MLYFALLYAAIAGSLIALQARTRPADLGVHRVRRYDRAVHAVGIASASLWLPLFVTSSPGDMAREDLPWLSILFFVTWWIVVGIGTGLRRRILERRKRTQAPGS